MKANISHVFALAMIAVSMAVQIPSRLVYASGEAKPSLATGGTERDIGDALTRLPLRFEACAGRTPARYVARTRDSTAYISATEATWSLRAFSGAGRLGCGADLGLPRNARSPQANEQLPEPRRDRAAPRPSLIMAPDRSSSRPANFCTTLQLSSDGANVEG